MIGKMTGQKSGIPLVEFLPQLFQEREKETGIGIGIGTGTVTGIGIGIATEIGTGTGTGNGKVKKKRPHGELRRIGNPFVVLKMRLMKMDGPQYDVKSQDGGFRLVSYIGLITFKDYYTCASTNLNWIL